MKRTLYILISLAVFVSFFINGHAWAEQKGLGDLGFDPIEYQSMMKTFPQPPYFEMVPPDSFFDWRYYGVVTPAKDQGACGSCWAFASAGVLESRVLIDGGPVLDLSEQQQVSCNTSYFGCCGGSYGALQYWYTNSPWLESCTGYGDYSTSCPTERNVSCATLSCSELPHRTANLFTVNTGSVDDVKTSIYEDGPAYFRFDFYDDFYTYWGSGSYGQVYTQTSGSKLGGHAVLIIGWDNSKAAWLCKNSWGATDGPNGDGTFWMAWSGHANSLNFGMANIERVQNTYYVGSLPGDFSTIQAALDEVLDGETIIVRDGTWTGTDNKNLDFGGKPITLRSENGPTKCIIDCESDGRGFYFHSGETSGSIVDGFTIVNGSTNGYSPPDGAGILCETSSPTITNCIIRNCATPYCSPGVPYCFFGGGAIACSSYSSPTITNCMLHDNYGYLGGGVMVGSFFGDSCAPTIKNCEITGNSSLAGGGIYVACSSVTVENSLISGNSSVSGGGGIGCDTFSNLSVRNSTVTGNSCSDSSDGWGGGGIIVFGATAIVTDSIFWNNSAPQGPEVCLAGYDDPATSLDMAYSDIEGGEAGVFVHPDCTGCSTTWGAGNIDSDPLFVGAGDYRLRPGSPCIDAGTDAGVSSDFYGNPRPYDVPGVDNNGAEPEFDMGAYESRYLYVDDDAICPGSGTSADPYCEIQPALTSSIDGDVVTVRNGTYIGANNKNLDFGGNAVALVSVNGATNTVIDCQGDGRGVHFQNGEGADSILRGFTIVNGNILGGYGGGIFCEGASPTIADCIMRENQAVGGGGIQCWESSSTILNSIITANSVNGFGGGIYCWDSEPNLTNCTITGNSAAYGGGISAVWYSSPTLANCILWDDSATEGPEIALYDSGTSLAVAYSDVEGGQSAAHAPSGTTLVWDATNINSDPLFVHGPLGFYYLSQTAAGQAATSPCVDAGSDTAANLLLDTLTTRTDQALDTGTVDMGYHYPGFGSWEPLDGVALMCSDAPPTFRWTPGQNDLFRVQLSTNNFAYVLTESPVLTGVTEWTMPADLWQLMPRTGMVMSWRVQGADSAVYPYVIETSEVRTFTKQTTGIGLLAPANGSLLTAPTMLEWEPGCNNMWQLQLSLNNFASIAWSSPYLYTPQYDLNAIWVSVPLDTDVSWRVRGAHTGEHELYIDMSEVWTFRKVSP